MYGKAPTTIAELDDLSATALALLAAVFERPNLLKWVEIASVPSGSSVFTPAAPAASDFSFSILIRMDGESASLSARMEMRGS